MKKILFSVVCLMMVGMQSVKAQVAVVALHHEGNVAFWGSAKIQDAIDNAVVGDTIYLSAGMFEGFTVAKNIAIIGSGVETNISGDVTIGTSTSLLLSNMNMLGRVSSSNSSDVTISGLRIVQCVIAEDLFLYRGNSVEILHSVIKGSLIANNNTVTVYAYNSKIYHPYENSSGSITLVNCNIVSCSGGGSPSCQNCIIGTLNNGGAYKNCLYKEKQSTTSTQDCYNNTDFSLDDNMNCSLSDAELLEKGYLGTDGKVVGINGGDVPFTLVSPILQVTEHKLEVDHTNRVLKATLKLGNK